MAGPMFGRLAGAVRPCRRRPRPAQVLIYGPAGSGKTLGGILMATGLRTGDGVIVVVSCEGENDSEEHYAEMAEFFHIGVANVTGEAVTEWNSRHRSRVPPAAEGTDPRALAAVIRELAASVPRGSVIVVDGLASAWDGTKSIVDGLGSKDNAWNVAGPMWGEILQALKQSPVHTISLCLARTETDVDKVDGKRRHYQMPVEPEMRRKDQARIDVRVAIDSNHRIVVVQGRCSPLNDSPPATLSREMGEQLRAYLEAGDSRSDVAPAAGDGPAPQAAPEEPAGLPQQRTKRDMDWAAFVACCELVDIEPAEVGCWVEQITGRDGDIEAGSRGMTRNALAYWLNLPAFRRMVRMVAETGELAEALSLLAGEVKEAAPSNSIAEDIDAHATQPGEGLWKVVGKALLLLDEARLQSQRANLAPVPDDGAQHGGQD